MFSLQVNFLGLTGNVRFGADGKRKDYTLEVMQMSLNNEPKTVINRHCAVITSESRHEIAHDTSHVITATSASEFVR